MPESTPIKNLIALAEKQKHAHEKMSPDAAWNLVLYGHISDDDKDTMIEHSMALKDFVDVNLLVNRHVLRQEGIEPGAVRIIVNPITRDASSFALPQHHLLVLNPDDIEQRRPDQIYVMLAHELTHMKQHLSGEFPLERMSEVIRSQRIHSNRRHEIEAFFWETQQGARFGWGRNEYKEYTEILYPKGRGAPAQFATERALRTQAAMPVLSRHPVPVRSYRRRRRA
jgi:hypothetical protein